MSTDTMGSLQFPAVLLVLLYTAMVPITEGIHMGLFPEAADYSFYNCREEMLKMVTKAGGLLQTELNNNKDFKKMWKDNEACEMSIPKGIPEHTTALKSYAEAGAKFHKTFYKLVHTKSRGSSTYQDEFPFKSLFFLLTDAMQLLKKSKCQTVYSGTEDEYDATIGDKVRFESFLSATNTYSEATENAAVSTTGTVFSISSCSVINLDVCESEDIALLISPTEVFTVQNITTVKNSNDHYKLITLVHSHFQSSSNCSGLESSPSPSSPSSSPSSSSSFLSSSLLSLMASLLVTLHADKLVKK